MWQAACSFQVFGHCRAEIVCQILTFHLIYLATLKATLFPYVLSEKIEQQNSRNGKSNEHKRPRHSFNRLSLFENNYQNRGSHYEKIQNGYYSEYNVGGEHGALYVFVCKVFTSVC